MEENNYDLLVIGSGPDQVVEVVQHELHGFGQDVRDGNRRPHTVPFGGHAARAVDDVAGACDLIDDALALPPEQVAVDVPPVEEAQHRSGGHADRRQGLADLMRDGGRQFAQRRDAGDMREFVTQPARVSMETLRLPWQPTPAYWSEVRPLLAAMNASLGDACARCGEQSHVAWLTPEFVDQKLPENRAVFRNLDADVEHLCQACTAAALAQAYRELELPLITVELPRSAMGVLMPTED